MKKKHRKQIAKQIRDLILSDGCKSIQVENLSTSSPDQYGWVHYHGIGKQVITITWEETT